MKIEDEYVFNNGIYDIAVRSLKATFFDVLSFCDSLEYNDDQDFSDKLTNLKSKMNDIIESVRDLDSYKHEDNNGVFIKSDTVLKNNSSDVIPIDYGDTVEEKEEINDVENVTGTEVEETDDNNSNNVIDQGLNLENTSDVQNKEIDNDILTFKKYNDDIVKAILVSDIQYSKLDNSKKSQMELLDQVNFFNEKPLNEEPVNQEENSSENLTEKAVLLYKHGKTKEAQEIMDKINSMNHVN